MGNIVVGERDQFLAVAWVPLVCTAIRESRAAGLVESIGQLQYMS